MTDGIDCVEELTDVHIKYPGIHMAVHLNLGNDLVRSLTWTMAIGIFLDDRFEYGSLHRYYHLLHYSISNRWYAQRASTTIGFWYFYQLYHFGKLQPTYAIPYLMKFDFSFRTIHCSKDCQELFIHFYFFHIDFVIPSKLYPFLLLSNYQTPTYIHAKNL